MFSSHENFLATELYGNLKHDVSVHEMHRNVLGNYNNYHHKHARGGGGAWRVATHLHSEFLAWKLLANLDLSACHTFNVCPSRK